MNRVIAYAVLFLVAITLVGANASDFVYLFGLMFLLFGAIHLMFRRRLPSAFGANFVLLIFGPAILLCLLVATLNSIENVQVNSELASILFLIVLFASSFYGWYWWSHRKSRGVNQSQFRSDEREFIVPFDHRPARQDEPWRDDES